MRVVDRFILISEIVDVVDSKEGSTFAQVISEIASRLKAKKTVVESLFLVAEQLGFIREGESGFASTASGRAFSKYVKILDLQEHPPPSVAPMSSGAIQYSDRLSVSLPPRWKDVLQKEFGNLLETTVNAERLVAEDVEKRLYIVCPYIDVAVLQTTLEPIYAPEAEAIILTSERKLVERNTDFLLTKLRNILSRRFAAFKVFHFEAKSMIVHAKVWVSEKSLFVTSANIQSESQTDNLEVGVYTENPELVSLTRMFLERVLQMGEVTCVLSG